MAEKTLADHITDIVLSEANNNPAPTSCTVIRNYTNDPTRIDVETSNGEYRYVQCIGSNTVGRKGVLIFLDGETPFAIIENRSI